MIGHTMVKCNDFLRVKTGLEELKTKLLDFVNTGVLRNNYNKHQTLRCVPKSI